MPAQLIRAGDLHPGAPYAYAAVAPPGSLIFTAGACPITTDGNVSAPGDYPRKPDMRWRTWSRRSLRRAPASPTC